MSGIVGVCLSFGGVMRLLKTFDDGVSSLTIGIRQQQNLSRMQAITKVAANALNLIGMFAISVGMILMGVTLASAEPHVAFMAVFNEAIQIGLPYLGGGLGSLCGGLILHQLSR